MNPDLLQHKPDPATAAWLAAMPHGILMLLWQMAAEGRGVFSDATAALLEAESRRRNGTEPPTRHVLAQQRN